jgi:hypothetical protein
MSLPELLVRRRSPEDRRLTFESGARSPAASLLGLTCSASDRVGLAVAGLVGLEGDSACEKLTGGARMASGAEAIGGVAPIGSGTITLCCGAEQKRGPKGPKEITITARERVPKHGQNDHNGGELVSCPFRSVVHTALRGAT